MKKLLLSITGIIILSLLLFYITVNKYYVHKSSAVMSSTKTSKTVLATSTTAKKTYVSKEDQYTVAYPATWTPDLLPPLDTSGSGQPIFSTGPIGNKALGFPSFIKIIVNDNTENLSLDTYIKQHFDTSLNFKPLSLTDKQGKEAQDVQNSLPKVITLFENNNKIYEIIWYQGAEPKITQQQFTQFLTDMKFS
jgi:hypothetical protein